MRELTPNEKMLRDYYLSKDENFDNRQKVTLYCACVRDGKGCMEKIKAVKHNGGYVIVETEFTGLAYRRIAEFDMGRRIAFRRYFIGHTKEEALMGADEEYSYLVQSMEALMRRQKDLAGKIAQAAKDKAVLSAKIKEMENTQDNTDRDKEQ